VQRTTTIERIATLCAVAFLLFALPLVAASTPGEATPPSPASVEVTYDNQPLLAQEGDEGVASPGASTEMIAVDPDVETLLEIVERRWPWVVTVLAVLSFCAALITNATNTPPRSSRWWLPYRVLEILALTWTDRARQRPGEATGGVFRWPRATWLLPLALVPPLMFQGCAFRDIAADVWTAIEPKARTLGKEAARAVFAALVERLGDWAQDRLAEIEAIEDPQEQELAMEAFLIELRAATDQVDAATAAPEG
jgi:hypothetical protein